MHNPVTATATAAIARRTLDGRTEAVQDTLDAMVDLVQSRLAGQPGAGDAVTRAQARPLDDHRFLLLELLVLGAFERDAEFAARLRQLYERFRAQTTTHHENTAPPPSAAAPMLALGREVRPRRPVSSEPPTAA